MYRSTVPPCDVAFGGPHAQAAHRPAESPKSHLTPQGRDDVDGAQQMEERLRRSVSMHHPLLRPRPRQEAIGIRVRQVCLITHLAGAVDPRVTVRTRYFVELSRVW